MSRKNSPDLLGLLEVGQTVCTEVELDECVSLYQQMQVWLGRDPRRAHEYVSSISNRYAT